jgi:hypothetical protein
MKKKTITPQADSKHNKAQNKKTNQPTTKKKLHRKLSQPRREDPQI